MPDVLRGSVRDAVSSWRRDLAQHVAASTVGIRVFTIDDSVGWALYESLPVEQDLV